jgi:hypothetical protein
MKKLLVGFKFKGFLIGTRRVWRYQSGNQNPYVEGKTIQWTNKTMIYKTLHRKLTIKHHKPYEDWGWAQMLCKGKQSLKIPRGLSEFVNRRRTDNTIDKKNPIAMIYKTLHRKQTSPLYCLSFDIQILITTLVSSNSSCPYRASELNPSLHRVYGAWSLVFCVVFCRSLLLGFFCRLYCLSKIPKW